MTSIVAESKAAQDEATQFTAEVKELILSARNAQIGSAPDVIALLTPMMSAAARFTHLSGTKKKGVVIAAAKAVVDEAPLDAQTRATVQMVLDFTLPTVIDQLYNLKPEAFNLVCCC